MNIGQYEWIILEGMSFRSMFKWWGDRGLRKYPHEGVDLCMFRDKNGNIHNIDEIFKAAVIYKGRIYRIIDDFMGKTLFVGHEIFDNSMQLFSVYGHVKPMDGIIEGLELRDNDIIGTVSNAKDTNIKPHIHLTMVWLPRDIPIDQLNWKTLNNKEISVLIDPFEIIKKEVTYCI